MNSRGRTIIETDACIDCSIEDNEIYTNQTQSTHAIVITEDHCSQCDGNQASANNNVIRNNSVYFGPNTAGRAIAHLVNSSQSNIVVNNAIYYAGNNNNWTCFHFSNLASSYEKIDNNICHFNAGSWAYGEGSFSQWQNNNAPMGSQSLAADPLFSNMVADGIDLRPSALNSPLIDSGDAANATLIDHDGNLRDAQPDVGAYEWQN